ncbi:MAG: chemotaxis protein CheB [Armatimonadota bacterium]
MTEDPGTSLPEETVDVPAAEAEALPPAPESEPQLPFLIVALGASAGGLAPLKAFFQIMPVDSGMALVVIQHLDPDRESLMVPLLQQQTAMPVVQVSDGMAVEPNRVHVIAPGTTMTLEDGLLRLREPETRRGMRLPIDAFFTSLAEAQGRRAAGIVLSGTASDGTEGLRDIKAHGGLAIAQDPVEAEQDGMPRSAMAAGLVDLVLPVAQMPEALLKYRAHPYVTAGEPQSAPESEETLRSILAIIASRVGHDFRGYRKSTLLRRIHRRMGFRAIADLPSYEKYLDEYPDEVSALFSDMLIGVTKFFREPEAWEALKKLVLRPLLERERDEPVRVWVPACSIGKEAYTLAMLLFSVMDELGKTVELQIFATDVDAESLAQARSGQFPLDVAQEVPPEYLERFFIGDERSLRVIDKVRKAIVFAPQNTVADPPFSRVDLISCRNLLIYLEPELQDRVLDIFHFSLNSGGYLFLGAAESAGRQDLLAPLSKQWRIYQKLEGQRTRALNLPETLRHPLPSPLAAPLGGQPKDGDVALYRLAESIVLERYAPASVVIDGQDQIVYYLGGGADFLRHPRGEPSDSLLAKLDDPLRSSVRSLIQQVREKGAKGSVVSSAIVEQERRPVAVDVVPLRGMRRQDQLLVVMRGEGLTGSAGQEPVEPGMRGLEQELGAAHEEMQGAIAQMESSNEELTASNEEMASMNEELQASNEELETSKEELQSVNEELRTVNIELEEKVAELKLATDDLNNLLRSTNIPTLFLDQQLRLKRFTPHALRLFSFLPTDVGRPITDLSLKLQGMDLIGDARRVLESQQPVTREVQAADGRLYDHRTQPYRAENDSVQGVVATFVDITDLANGRTELLRRAEQLKTAALQLTEVEHTERRRLAHLVHDGIQQWMLAAKFKIILAMDMVTDVATDAAMQEILVPLNEGQEAVDSAIAQARDLTMQLSPPVSERKPLRESLQWLAHHYLDRYQYRVHIHADPNADPEQQLKKVVLFEAARELVLNSVKHSGVKDGNVTLALEGDDTVLLTVSDAGAGFDPTTVLAEAGGFGLFSIRERMELLGGSMKIESAPGQGTTFSIRVPKHGAQETVPPATFSGLDSVDATPGPISL